MRISDLSSDVCSSDLVLDRMNRSSDDHRTLYDALIGAASWQFLHFDARIPQAFDKPVSHNVNWPDFGHAITFGNALRVICDRYPPLLPQGLLQLRCFVGPNAGLRAKNPEPKQG